MSCDFKNLDRQFNSCKICQIQVDEYIAQADWTCTPATVRCKNCISWDVEQLQGCKYKTLFPLPEEFLDTSPGYSLFQSPGQLTSELLIAGWNHAIDMFVHQQKWIQTDVQRYLHQLCINDSTIDTFLQSCRNHVLLKEVKLNHSDYEQEEIARTILDYNEKPEEYDLPKAPAM